MIRIFEVFRDADALAHHRASSHMAQWRAALPTIGIHDRDLWQYEAHSAQKI